MVWGRGYSVSKFCNDERGLYAETGEIHCVSKCRCFPLYQTILCCHSDVWYVWYVSSQAMHGMYTHYNGFYLERRKISTNSLAIHFYTVGMYVEVK